MAALKADLYKIIAIVTVLIVWLYKSVARYARIKKI